MIAQLRIWVARACLRWALQLDPDIPLAQVERIVGTGLERGLRQTWVVFLSFPEHQSASAFESWLLYHRQHGWD